MKYKYLLVDGEDKQHGGAVPMHVSWNRLVTQGSGRRWRCGWKTEGSDGMEEEEEEEGVDEGGCEGEGRRGREIERRKVE